MPSYHLDYETFSTQPLSGSESVGAHRYIADLTGEPLMLAIAKDDEPPRILLPRETLRRLGWEQDAVAVGWLRELSAPDSLCWAHNAAFEQAVTRWKPALFTENDAQVPRLDQWRCTMTLALRAGIPASLEECAETLKLPQQKDKEGDRLKRIFTKPRTAGKLKGQRIYPWDEPEEFKKFISYCLQDVRTEREVHKALKPFEFRGFLLDAYLLDIRLNNRGIPVNVEALRTARSIIEEAVQAGAGRFAELTGGLSPAQREKVLVWLKARGYPEPDMTALSVKRAFKKIESWAWCPDAATAEALKLKQELSFAATAKIDKMLACEISGRIYGTMQFYGAGTGRWAGRLIQPQNFKRPTIKNTEAVYEALRAGYVTDADTVSTYYGPPLEVLSSCIRHFIDAGQPLLSVDFSAVEARLVCWEAGETKALGEYRQGIDRYKLAASKVFGVPVESISKDGMERFIGKEAVLGCGYQMGWKKFMSRCMERAEIYGLKVTSEQDIYKRAVASYREEHPRVKELWWACDSAARNAVLNPGKRFSANDKLSFVTVPVSGIPFLIMRLPSGRTLSYPWPQITPCRKPVKDKHGNQQFDEDTGEPIMRDSSDLSFYGQDSLTRQWGRIKTYGGKLLENATQATGWDLMVLAMLNAEKRGLEPFMTVHDELETVAGDCTPEELCRIVTQLPPWAEGLPLAAEAKKVPFYKK